MVELARNDPADRRQSHGNFSVRATDKGGKEIRGKIDASSDSVVAERLRSMGYYPPTSRS
jgi:type II secretory pathway component PulF